MTIPLYNIPVKMDCSTVTIGISTRWYQLIPQFAMEMRKKKKRRKKMPGSGRLNLVIIYIYIYGLLYPIVVILVTVYI